MMETEQLHSIYQGTQQVLTELLDTFPLTEEHILVLGVSTSEVIGSNIGTSGTEEVAAVIYRAASEFQEKYQFHLAFQCCEHLNRALVLEKKTAKQFQLEEVTVVPVPKAGGAMASYVYKQLQHPTMVEHIRADAGIDIGDTFIGMHLKHVAVPLRSSLRNIGEAHVTMAITRPKLIGGARAVYIISTEKE
ncbi:TIGR01440 family protein [Caldalkalibacillus mannanilyticus]|uniref:TIGR01440 family protein n=1 Tax=Caldalkalibacillus mannanilyticus TaxID=1418 RepID=UPI000B0C0C21|nr:TIGR01440 family protein [Caldalkalibacillus mannanilyticus]